MNSQKVVGLVKEARELVFADLATPEEQEILAREHAIRVEASIAREQARAPTGSPADHLLPADFTALLEQQSEINGQIEPLLALRDALRDLRRNPWGTGPGTEAFDIIIMGDRLVKLVLQVDFELSALLTTQRELEKRIDQKQRAGTIVHKIRHEAHKAYADARDRAGTEAANKVFDANEGLLARAEEVAKAIDHRRRQKMQNLRAKIILALKEPGGIV